MPKTLQGRLFRKLFEIAALIIGVVYSGLRVKEIEEIRRAMREKGAKFRITKNSLTKLALEKTKIESITNLFNGPTAVAYSSDPIVPAKIAVEFEKKFDNFKIIGGAFEGEKIGEEKIQYIASLLSLDEIRSKLVGFLTTPAQKIASVLAAPAGQLVRLMDLQSKNLESSK